MTSKTSESGSRKFKLMIIDDHAVFREGLALIIEQEQDMTVCGEFESATPALKEVGTLKPDMAIIDISLEGTNGVELCKQLRARFPEMRLLILSMHKEFLYAERVLRAGANGYIMKQEGRKKLMLAIRHVLKGETYVSDAVKESILQNLSSTGRKMAASSIDRLSDRELEVFQFISRGYGTRQIADSLNVSMKTIETHREHIREKLNLKTTFELMQYALEWASQQRI
jgi:DNA-binding NarL/FixJ family response regulator